MVDKSSLWNYKLEKSIVDYNYLQCTTTLVAASELTALTSPLDRMACRGGHLATAKTTVPHLNSYFIQRMQSTSRCYIEILTIIYISIRILKHFVQVFFRLTKCKASKIFKTISYSHSSLFLTTLFQYFQKNKNKSSQPIDALPPTYLKIINWTY